jgi:hypothetical protein
MVRVSPIALDVDGGSALNVNTPTEMLSSLPAASAAAINARQASSCGSVSRIDVMDLSST